MAPISPVKKAFTPTMQYKKDDDAMFGLDVIDKEKKQAAIDPNNPLKEDYPIAVGGEIYHIRLKDKKNIPD